MEIEVKQTKTVRMNRKEVEEAISERLRLFDILTAEDMTIRYEHDIDNVDEYCGCKIVIERFDEKKG